MKVLFVSGGNSSFGISPLVRTQGDTLRSLGLTLDYFPIKGKGFCGYLKNIGKLRQELRLHNYDVIHAHFSFSGFVAALAGAKPLVVSLMGWNVQQPVLKLFIKLFNKMSWDACIVKSTKMIDSLGIKGLELIPNGVDFNVFRPISRLEAVEYLGWEQAKRHILFAANPDRPIKDFTLAQKAFEVIKKDTDTDLHYLNCVKHEDMIYYYNAADIVLLTSKAEGSPNVIKEALACNCVIVSTDVGDVKERFGNNRSCFLCDHYVDDVVFKLRQALAYEGERNTRESMSDIDSKVVAQKILSIYEKLIRKQIKGSLFGHI